MKSAFRAALAKANAEGHAMEHDPPLGSEMSRYTCRKCGKAVLGNASVAYGAATEGPCEVKA